MVFVIIIVTILLLVFFIGPSLLEVILNRIEDWTDILEDIKDCLYDWLGRNNK